MVLKEAKKIYSLRNATYNQSIILYSCKKIPSHFKLFIFFNICLGKPCRLCSGQSSSGGCFAFGLFHQICLFGRWKAMQHDSLLVCLWLMYFIWCFLLGLDAIFKVLRNIWVTFRSFVVLPLCYWAMNVFFPKPHPVRFYLNSCNDDLHILMFSCHQTHQSYEMSQCFSFGLN